MGCGVADWDPLGSRRQGRGARSLCKFTSTNDYARWPQYL